MLQQSNTSVYSSDTAKVPQVERREQKVYYFRYFVIKPYQEMFSYRFLNSPHLCITTVCSTCGERPPSTWIGMIRVPAC